MKQIFLDTNILIDYIDNRAGADDAEQIFACGFHRPAASVPDAAGRMSLLPVTFTLGKLEYYRQEEVRADDSVADFGWCPGRHQLDDAQGFI